MHLHDIFCMVFKYGRVLWFHHEHGRLGYGMAKGYVLQCGKEDILEKWHEHSSVVWHGSGLWAKSSLQGDSWQILPLGLKFYAQQSTTILVSNYRYKNQY